MSGKRGLVLRFHWRLCLPLLYGTPVRRRCADICSQKSGDGNVLKGSLPHPAGAVWSFDVSRSINIYNAHPGNRNHNRTIACPLPSPLSPCASTITHQPSGFSWLTISSISRHASALSLCVLSLFKITENWIPKLRKEMFKQHPHSQFVTLWNPAPVES